MIKRKYKPEGYKCLECNAIFPTPQSLGGHVTSVHRIVDLDWIIEEKKKIREYEKGKKFALYRGKTQ